MNASPDGLFYGRLSPVFPDCPILHFLCHHTGTTAFWFLRVVIETAPVRALALPRNDGQDTPLSFLVVILLRHLQTVTEMSPPIAMTVFPEVVTLLLAFL